MPAADGTAAAAVLVRPAGPADLEAALALGKMMHAESDYRDEPFEDDLVRTQLPGLVGKAAVFFAVAEAADGSLVGFIIATVARRFFNRRMYADEFLTYVRPEWRGRGVFQQLLAAWEQWARDRGLTHTFFGRNTDWSAPESITPLMARLGYTHVGAAYQKALQ